MTHRLVHVAGHDRKPPVRKSLANTKPHLEFVGNNAVMTNLLAHTLDLTFNRTFFVSPELQAIEREDPEMARRVGETY